MYINHRPGGVQKSELQQSATNGICPATMGKTLDDSGGSKLQESLPGKQCSLSSYPLVL